MTEIASIIPSPVIPLPLRSMTPVTAQPDGFLNCPSFGSILLLSLNKIFNNDFIINLHALYRQAGGQNSIFRYFEWKI